MYEVTSSLIVYDGVLSRIRVDTVRMPDGDSAEREVVEHPDAVAMVPLLDDGRIVLLRQYRHPLGRRMLELPAGKLDDAGESAVEAARRELVEEVGLDATTFDELVTFHNSSGWTDESTTVYLARGLHESVPPDGFQAQHEEADMQIVRLPLDEAVAMATTGEISDAKTLIGLLVTAGRLGEAAR